MGNFEENHIYNTSYASLKRKVVIVLIAALVFMNLPEFCSAHDHLEEPPSFKYSKEANENLDKGNHQHSDGHYDHHHHHHSHDHGHDHSSHTNARKPLDMFSIWTNSLGSTFLISAAPYLLLYIIPLDNTDKMKPRLKVLLAFASGGLLGDAFLHLIPHATHPHDHSDHNHSHGHDSDPHDMSVGLWVLSGIITFLAVEKGVRLIKGGHGHSHGNPVNKKEISTKKDLKDKQNKVNAPVKEKKNKEEKVEISGYLNLAADFAHNFTDGLAIGASYLAGNSIGIVTTVTILLHEVPHEIGDFAILIKSGCSRRKAMLLQLVTAIGALAGTTLALLGAGDDTAIPWVLPFTAGGFIYIATVSVLPELLEESTKLGQSLKEISALLAGVGLMIIIANFE